MQPKWTDICLFFNVARLQKINLSKRLFRCELNDCMEYFRNKSKANLAVTTAIVFLSIAILTSMEHNFTNVRAQTDLTNITVCIGFRIKPDKTRQGTVSLGVETTNNTAQATWTSNSNLMNKVLESLKSAGVQENETSTSTFSISPNYNYSSNNNQGRLIGFTVSNSIQIESTNIESVSKWIDASVSAGANNVNNIYFSLSNQKSDDMKNSLLKDAIDNAKIKADTATSARRFEGDRRKINNSWRSRIISSCTGLQC